MVQVRASAVGDVPVEAAFRYVDDYRNVPSWMYGISKFEPSGSQITGVGAVFEATIKLGPATLNTTVECTRWEENRLIALTSIKGFKNTSTWEFAAHGDDQVELTAVVDYELPGGLAGRALGKMIEPFVSIAVSHTERTLRQRMEEHHAG